MLSADVLGALSADDLGQLVGKLRSAQAGLAAEVVSVVQEVDRRGLWKGDGSVRLSHWVAELFALTAKEAGRLVRVARALVDLEEVHAALADGRLSWAKVAALVDIVDGPGDEAFWVRAAEGSTVEHLEAVARRRRKERRDRDADDAAGAARNSLRMVADPDNATLRFWGRMVGDDAARLQTFVESTAKNEVRPAPGEEMDPWDVRCGDALAVVTSAALGGLSRDRATLNVHLDADALESGGHRGQVSMKPPEEYPVEPSVLERLMCDCRWRAVIDGPDGSVLRFSEAEHPPPALEQAVLRRDVHCVIRGCRATHGEIHHLHWRSRGGKTVLQNLVFLCWRHHRMVHDLGWSLTGEPSALTWARPNGTVVWTSGHRRLAA